MRLDQLKWEPYHRSSRWKMARFGVSVAFLHGPRDLYDIYETFQGAGRIWKDLDPIDAQCILYHLTSNPER